MTGDFGRRAFLGGMAGTAALAALPAAAQRAAAGDFGPVDALLRGWVADGRVPGAVFALVRPGRFRPAYRAHGRDSFEGGRAIDERSIFRIYSMTKPVTGIAAMMEVADGRATLDEDIARRLPAFARPRVAVNPSAGLDARPAEGPIRLRHLLTHTAGLSYSILGDGPIEREYRRLGLMPGSARLTRRPGDGDEPDLAGFAERLATVPLAFEPGSAWRYSVALDLMGAWLEQGAGMAFPELLYRRLFRPLGMADTGFHVPAAAMPRLVAGYGWLDQATGQRLERPLLIDSRQRSEWAAPPRLPTGGAGLVSTAADYARFAQMLLDDGLFEGRRVMDAGAARLAQSNLMPGALRLADGHGHGAGGRVQLFDTRPDAPAGVAHGVPPGVFGWGGAASTLFAVDRARGHGWVVLMQALPSTLFPLATEMGTAINAMPGLSAAT